MKPKAAILYGYGINCDHETQYGFELAGADARRIHINQLIENPAILGDHQILAVPGGFSFGDDLGAGKVLALKLKYRLGDSLNAFLNNGKLAIGICNGFQVLVKLGILPGLAPNKQEATLTNNDNGRFQDRWINLRVNQASPCVWTKGIDRLFLPIRHGEGKFAADDGVLAEVLRLNLAALQYCDPDGHLKGYPHNPNGSAANIAGVCDPTGRVFGMMPHPEGFMFSEQDPFWTRRGLREPQGRQIFKNAVDFVLTSL